MANYKNIKFGNTMSEYKRWVEEFPPMDPDAVKAVGFQKKEDYYLECQLVQGFLNSDKFVNASVRMYDPEEKNFENVGMEKEEDLLNTVFKNKVDAFKNKYL